MYSMKLIPIAKQTLMIMIFELAFNQQIFYELQTYQIAHRSFSNEVHLMRFQRNCCSMRVFPPFMYTASLSLFLAPLLALFFFLTLSFRLISLSFLSRRSPCLFALFDSLPLVAISFFLTRAVSLPTLAHFSLSFCRLSKSHNYRLYIFDCWCISIFVALYYCCHCYEKTWDNCLCVWITMFNTLLKWERQRHNFNSDIFLCHCIDNTDLHG